ncbi:MAG: AAA family ATPase [Nitrososphaerota archaeon]
MPRVFYIAGTPGVGKTTLGQLVSQKAGLKFMELINIVQGNQLNAEIEIDGRTLSIYAGKLIRKLAEDSLIATHIAFKPRGVNVERIFVLRRDPFSIIATLTSRGYPEEKVLENAEAEFLGIVYFEMLKKFGSEKTLQINVSNKTIEESVNLLLNGIRGEYINEEIDWMQILEEDNRLDKLLSLFSKRLRLV